MVSSVSISSLPISILFALSAICKADSLADVGIIISAPKFKSVVSNGNTEAGFSKLTAKKISKLKGVIPFEL